MHPCLPFTRFANIAAFTTLGSSVSLTGKIAQQKCRDEPEKIYTIAEAARSAGSTPSTLRLWEKEGLVLPDRSKRATGGTTITTLSN
ncbi:MerR family DNA-binding transcriptional regulator (plasmid) [Rhizobium beringeri]|nr:MerR family DNA-binding transcriptional regulator [Rhizobium beringeri]